MKSLLPLQSFALILTLAVLPCLTLLFSCGDHKILPEGDRINLDSMKIVCGLLPPSYYSGIHFTSPLIAYIISNDGKIFKTIDGGNAWVQQNSGTELHLYDMFFKDDLNGYIVGGDSNGIILKTTDGGNTWLPTNTQSGLFGVHFINDTTGFISGNGMFFKTQDGGETWNEIDLGYSAYGSLDFFDSSTGFLTTGNIILKTTDGGNNWVAIKSMDYSIKRIQIFNGIAYLFSNGIKIFITPDQGNTWSSIEPPTLNSIYFINERQAVGVGRYWPDLGFFSNGIIYITNDGGNSWQQKQTQADEFYSLEDIDFSNDSTALAVGQTSSCVIKLRF